MSISEPVFFLIDPYSAFYVLFAANLVSHNSVFLHRPKTQNAHGGRNVMPRCLSEGVDIFLKSADRQGESGHDVRISRLTPWMASVGGPVMMRTTVSLFIRKFTPGDATSRRDVPFAAGVRGFFTNSQVKEQLKLSISILHTSFCGENAQKQYRRFDDNIQTSDKFQEISCNRFVNVLSSNYSNGNVTGNNTDTDSETVTGTYKNYEVTRTNIKER